MAATILLLFSLGLFNAVKSDFAGECLFAHNKARSQHEDTPNLKWDADVEAAAQKYAKELADRNQQSSSSRYYIGHSSGAGSHYGENIYAGHAGGFEERKISNAMYFWYREGIGYNYENPAPWSHTVHFTQVIWKSTSNVGCGKATYFKDYKIHTIIVCQYKPKGNISMQYIRNVKKLKAGGKSSFSVEELTGVEKPTSVSPGGGCPYTNAVPRACSDMKPYCNDISNKFLMEYLQENCKKTCNC